MLLIIIIYIVLIIVQLYAPARIGLLLFLINLIFPDPIPFIDEFIQLIIVISALNSYRVRGINNKKNNKNYKDDNEIKTVPNRKVE